MTTPPEPGHKVPGDPGREPDSAGQDNIDPPAAGYATPAP